MSQGTSLVQKPVTKTNDYLASTLTLARWRLRQTGGLLFMACLGFILAMVISCVVPLFTTVASASSLQTLLQAEPARNDLTLSVNTQGLSSAVAGTVQQQVTPLVQQRLGPYLHGSTALTVQEAGVQVLSPGFLQHVEPLNIYATSLNSLKPHLRLLAGRWPESSTSDLEIMLTPMSANELHLALGARLILQGDFSRYNLTGGPIDAQTAFNAQLVGLFSVQTPASVTLHGQNFQPVSNGIGTLYTFLTDTTAFLHTLDQTATQLHTDAIFSYLAFQLTWDYSLQTSHVEPAQLSDLINRLSAAQNDVGNYESNQQRLIFGTVSFPYVTQVSLYSPVPGSFDLLDLLKQYTNRTALVNIPLTILALQIIALLLFFVSVLVAMLLDRQTAANALLSSRGASNTQVFWSLFFQVLALCLLGVVLGPLAALAIVSLLVSRVLPVSGVPIAQSVLAQPSQVFSSVGLMAGGTLLVALLTIGLIVRYHSGLNMLTLRRETARVTRQPFWQRYYFDVLAAMIALSGYGVSLYLASVAHEVDITTQDLILAPLTLVAPIFLLLGCLLLFLRIFPWLLRSVGRIAHRGRGAVAVLALVQMGRAPRQIIRMTLLLSLTISFAIFAQVFSASQNQRINDISAYEAGADFSGNLSANLVAQQLSLNTLLARYRALPGVLSASADYTDEGTTTGSSGGPLSIQFRAIDPQSFAQTVIWNSQDSSQPLSKLLLLLTGASAASLPGASQTVPAIIDQALAQQLHLNVGGTFTLSLNTLLNATFSCQIVAIVSHIPTVNSNVGGSSGGMLVAYQPFANVYAAIPQKQRQSSNQTAQASVVPLNHIWLRTTNDAHSLMVIRAALNSSPLALSNLYDRRQIVAELQSDPFNLTILIILSIGAFTAFLLALIGSLISSWLSVYTRRDSFVVLRALGGTARQIAGVLLWEQGVIYICALALGLAFGALLTGVAVPVLVFTGLPAHGPMSNLSISDLYLLQQALPPRIVVPFSLDLIFAALVLICLITLLVMIRTALRPSISRELRLSQD